MSSTSDFGDRTGLCVVLCPAADREIGEMRYARLFREPKGDDCGTTHKPLQFDALVRLGGDRGDHRFSYSKNRED